MSYHQFQNEDGESYGSFEVFFTCGSFDQESEEVTAPGFYWCAGFPGCLPDGDAIGPFETEDEALADALER